ncbi:type II toxin-antitoxin system RelE/ParE family toxin [Labrys wisconsinensis]|uniref:Phage-related protein n=1 Tax=Labrys wisconsinensis TaxID=425677 RepID=A0ABU0JAJ1_9HYPH|nr:type II toxin-antitoxin system RelE/ParE family toxin [Labrys wisconsinensis]MDQ0470458.1 phage-related protein [Labrys wisconsinensis]
MQLPTKRKGRPLARYCKKDIFLGIPWTVSFLNADVRAELEALPRDIVASFLRISRLIEAGGLHEVHEPYVKHLQGVLWEMRLKGKDGIARAAYVTATGQRVVIVRVFAKKTQKTPRREIELALQRAKEVR